MQLAVMGAEAVGMLPGCASTCSKCRQVLLHET
jgi:hypothetical protein